MIIFPDLIIFLYEIAKLTYTESDGGTLSFYMLAEGDNLESSDFMKFRIFADATLLERTDYSIEQCEDWSKTKVRRASVSH